MSTAGGQRPRHWQTHKKRTGKIVAEALRQQNSGHCEIEDTVVSKSRRQYGLVGCSNIFWWTVKNGFPV